MDLHTRQHVAKEGARKSIKKEQIIWNVSNKAPKTKNFVDASNIVHIQGLEISKLYL